MKVKDLIKVLETRNPEHEALLAGYDNATGKVILRYVSLCCNTEKQDQFEQVWFSDQGLPATVQMKTSEAIIKAGI